MVSLKSVCASSVGNVVVLATDVRTDAVGWVLLGGDKGEEKIISFPFLS